MSQREPDLGGRQVVVSGGTRGLGGAISRALAARGAIVHAWYRADHENARRTAADVRAAGGVIEVDAGQLGEPEEVRRLATAVLARTDRLDGFVHCAALGSFKPALAVRPAQFDLSLAVGARSFLLCSQQLAPAMVEGGRIVALSSLGASRVVPSYGALGVAKAALEALVRELAVELAPRGIRVNAVSAGPVEESSIRAHPDYGELLAKLRARTPSGALVTAETVANLVTWLFSPLADGLHGQILVADGGYSLLL